MCTSACVRLERQPNLQRRAVPLFPWELALGRTPDLQWCCEFCSAMYNHPKSLNGGRRRARQATEPMAQRAPVLVSASARLHSDTAARRRTYVR